jgi:type VI secretion system secreted protein Hcp
MAVEAFLKLGDIKGESIKDGFKEQMEILAWSWGVSNSGTMHRAEGGGGQANIQDISFTKYMDAASAALLGASVQGTRIKEAVFSVRKAGGKPLPYLIIKLDDVLVSSYSTGGSGGEDTFTENLTLNFNKVNFSYQPQDKTGAKKGGEKVFEHDIQVGVKA